MYTPGPWTLETPEHFGIRDQYRICYEHPTLGTRYIHPETITVMREDAHLMAAAPQVVAALERIAVWLIAPDLSQGTLDEMSATARAALAAARGGE